MDGSGESGIVDGKQHEESSLSTEGRNLQDTESEADRPGPLGPWSTASFGNRASNERE